MKKERIWTVLHGQDLDQLINQAHTDKQGKDYQVSSIQTQYLNNEYVVTVIMGRAKPQHYELVEDQWLDGNDSLPAPCRLSDQLKQLAKNGMDFEVVSYTNENRINSDGHDFEYSTALLRVYDV